MKKNKVPKMTSEERAAMFKKWNEDEKKREEGFKRQPIICPYCEHQHTVGYDFSTEIKSYRTMNGVLNEGYAECEKCNKEFELYAIGKTKLEKDRNWVGSYYIFKTKAKV